MTLTEAAFQTRRAINWIVLAMVAYFLLRIIWGIMVTTYMAIFPPKPPPPNNAFSVLPAIKFPDASGRERPQLVLETIEGTVPVASDTAAVYFMPKRPPNLLAIDNTKEFAGKLAFDTTPIQESKNVYRFADPRHQFRRLRYDIVNGNFILRYDFEKDLDLFKDRNVQFLETAMLQARNTLEVYDLMTEDLENGFPKLTYLRINSDQLQQTTSLSKADAVRIDFFRRPVDSLELITPFPDEAPVSFIFSGTKDNARRLLQWAYTFWPIDYDQRGTYALKSSQIAWEELVAGGGFIARYPQKDPKRAVVRSARLAYFDSFEPQNYLQPIFVFEGDDGFMAFVPAVARPWTEDTGPVINSPTSTPAP